MKAAERRIFAAENLRKWQRLSRARRCPLEKLAEKLGCSRDMLRNMLAKGPRNALRKTASKKMVLESAKQLGFSKKKPYFKPWRRPCVALILQKLAAPGITVRSAQRLLRDVRLEGRNGYKKYWKKWHQENPNQELSDPEFSALERLSQEW